MSEKRVYQDKMLSSENSKYNIKKCVETVCEYPEALDKFIDANILKLMKEFADVPQNEKTTITRNSLLDMIGKLEALRK